MFSELSPSIKIISKEVQLSIEELESFIEIPKDSTMGDYAFPCFKLAKQMRKAPQMIAAELKDKLNLDGFEKIENLGPYVNFFVDKGVFTKNTIEKILIDLQYLEKYKKNGLKSK